MGWPLPPRCDGNNGSSMKGATILAPLEKLGIMQSFSRPRVNNDNAGAESSFRIALRLRRTFNKLYSIAGAAKTRTWRPVLHACAPQKSPHAADFFCRYWRNYFAFDLRRAAAKPASARPNSAIDAGSGTTAATPRLANSFRISVPFAEAPLLKLSAQSNALT